MTMPPPVTDQDAMILLIDDDPDILMLVEAMLRPLGVRVVSAPDATAGIALADTTRPDLILLDHDLPDATGLEVLARLQAAPRLAEVPVIVVTGSERRDVLTACFSAGAADYLRKPFFGAELRARVQTVLDHRRLVAELGRAAHVDTLTGLPNRALLQRRLQGAIERARDVDGYGFAVMFLDIDRFKLINDSLGHDMGDLLLREIARRLRANLRPQDSVGRDVGGTTVARLGGDEFVVVLDDLPDGAAASSVADRLIAVLEEPYQLGQHLVRSSASVGIVHSDAGYTHAEEMLRDADIAMYEAKARGKGCHARFTPAMREAVRRRLRIETALRDALGTDQFHLVYQPIVSLETRRLEGVEALLRWRHPELGLLMPGEFIPVAEETRLILPLADRVLQMACTQFAEWQHRFPRHAPPSISVNLSRVQLADPGLVARSLAIMQQAGVDPSQVQLEVTESQLMQQRTMAMELLDGFKHHGVRLAMDDFGAGYSSLSCLQEYPFDVLKIDRALIEQVNRGRGYAALLHAVVTLAENLGLDVVAEGIERPEQLALLQGLGCTYGQGFLIDRPLEVAVLEARWRNAQWPEAA
ncbi:MAG: EAL domain-containing protein [Gemmatimonadetes bacterium]|nr:EAL domain-containing protein [Gemmatimonadota bacterium]